jgi:hypothetical protein
VIADLAADTLLFKRPVMLNLDRPSGVRRAGNQAIAAQVVGLVEERPIRAVRRGRVVLDIFRRNSTIRVVEIEYSSIVGAFGLVSLIMRCCSQICNRYAPHAKIV